LFVKLKKRVKEESARAHIAIVYTPICATKKRLQQMETTITNIYIRLTANQFGNPLNKFKQ